jgi:UDP-glucose 4-epimerase
MTRCLVTGHQGYIGTHLFKELENQGHEVIGIDYKNDPNQDLLSVFDNDKAYEWFKPEVIFHMACIPRVAYSMEYPVETMTNNVLATTKVLNFARKVKAKRVVYSGSSSVVGDGTSPNSPYGLQKLISEMECRLYAKVFDIDTVTLRYFNVYSPDQSATGPYATAISNYMQYIRDGRNPFITGDGEQRRDMVNVKDVVSANIFAMESETDFHGQYFDIGTGKNISLNEIKKIVLEHFPDIEFEYVPDRPGDILFTQADIEPINNLGWYAEIDIRQGIAECFENLKKELHLNN